MPDRGGRPLAWAALVLSVVAGVALVAHVASGPAILGGRWHLLWELGAACGAWAVGLGAVAGLGDRRAVLVAVLVAGVALRVAALDGGPRLSDDLYRYSWDATTQLHGTDPYRYPPDSPALAARRGPWLWPDPAGCARLHRPPGCTRINRPAVRTIYPPVAEAWFAVVFAAAGGMAARAAPWQVAGVLTEAATMALLARVLARHGRDRRWVALYALCPLAALEVVNDGHVDGLAIALSVGALAALGPGPGRRPWRPWLAGALVGAATLTKLYPAALLVPVWAAPGMSWRDRTRAGVAAAGVVVAGYLPHVAAVGVHVLGYLPGYLKEEHYTGTATRYLLVDLLHLGPHGSAAAIALAVAATCAALLRVRPDAATGATVLLGVLLLCATPVQPWYGCTLLAVAAAAGRPAWTGVLLAGFPYFFGVILDYRHAAGVGALCFGAAATLIVAAAAASTWRRRRARGSAAPGGPSTAPQPEPARP